MSKEEKNSNRFESYPRPSASDEQLKNQPEFINEQPENSDDQPIRNVSDSNEEPPSTVKENRRDTTE